MKVKTTLLAMVLALAMPTMAQAQGQLLKKKVMRPKKEATATPTNLTVTKTTATTATVDWTPAADETTWNLRYRKYMGLGETTTWDFSGDNPLSDFLQIDADGDGNLWFIGTFDGNPGAWSRVSDSQQIFTPDNWLVIKNVQLGGAIAFEVRGELQSTHNIGVFVSTAEDPSDTTSYVQVGADVTIVNDYEPTTVEFDLSAYEGLGHIAIRHYNSTLNSEPGHSYVKIDNISLTVPAGTQEPWTEVDGIAEKPYTLTGLESETEYEAQVQAVIGEGETSGWTASARFTTLNAKAEPTDVTVKNITGTSADIDWTVNGAETEWNIRYRPYIFNGKSWNFNTSDQYADLQIFDSDGDGNNWGLTYLDEAQTDVALYSESYSNGTGALSPDNWIILPKVTLGGSLSFRAWAYSASWPENMGVFVSTAEQITSVDDFVQVGADIQIGEEKTYEFDLSQFEGEGYIAFRHYNVTDMFRFYVDDVTVNFPEGTIAQNEWTEVDGITEKPYTITGLEPETEYEAQVQAVYGEGDTGEWTESARFTTPVVKIPPTDVTADNITDTSADISWTVNGIETEWNIRYRTYEELFSCDFEEETDTVGWNMIDADGDGYNWIWNYNGESHRLNCNGEGCMYSESYNNDTQSALTPDNWLVTPKVTLSGTLSFVALGQDASYAAEVFAVYVSTTSNSDVSTFTKISDDITATGDITTYSFDLSAYEGQEGYVAIRHYNVSDMFLLNVDDVTIGKIGEWIEVKGVTENPYTLTGLDPETTYEVQVQPVYDDDTTGDWTDKTTFTTLVATGINAANTKTESAEKTFYNLQGVKMSGKPTQKGVYIVNGSKVVIK